MKMNYLSHAKRRHWGKIHSLIFIVAICTALFFARSFVVQSISYLAAGLSSMLDYVMPSFKSSRDLANLNAGLEQKVILLTAQNADRNILASENESLKAGLGRDDKEKVVYATIIKRPPSSPYDTFILDVGSDTGIAVGDEVVFGSVAIGSIVETSSRYAKAKLYSSPGNVFEGLLNGDTHVQAKGLGGGAFEVTVPLGLDVAEGVSLVLPSISPKIFGLAQKIENMGAEGFKKLLFSLPINPNQINSVGVVLQ